MAAGLRRPPSRDSLCTPRFRAPFSKCARALQVSRPQGHFAPESALLKRHVLAVKAQCSTKKSSVLYLQKTRTRAPAPELSAKSLCGRRRFFSKGFRAIFQAAEPRVKEELPGMNRTGRPRGTRLDDLRIGTTGGVRACLKLGNQKLTAVKKQF